MKFVDIKPAILKHWQSELKGKPLLTPPPEARFITGKPSNDAHLYFMETEFGIRVQYNTDKFFISDYDVVDEKKYAMFILRWA